MESGRQQPARGLARLLCGQVRSLALLNLLVLVIAPSLGAKETTTEFHLYAVPGVPGLLAGIAETQTNKRTSFAYMIRYRGLEDKLSAGEVPETHFNHCVTSQAEEGLFGSKQDPDDRRASCLEALVLWGHVLLSNPMGKRLGAESAEKELGWHFAKSGFELLLADLTGATEGQERFRRINAHRDFDFPMELLTMQKPPNPVRDAAMRYYSYVWTAFPEAPDTFSAFRHKIVVAEQLKQLYFKVNDEETPIDRALAESGLVFFDQAYRFHQLAVPFRGRHPIMSQYIPALLLRQVRDVGVGYAVFPWDAGTLRPTAALAITDLEGSQLLLFSMKKTQQISEPEFTSRFTVLGKEASRVQIAEDEKWLEQAREQGDVDLMNDLRLELASFRGGIGEMDVAESLLTQVCQQLHNLGDLMAWAKRTVDLASFKISHEQWRDALDLIEQAKPILEEEFAIRDAREALERALEYAQQAREKLGQPAENNAWLASARKGLEGFPNVEEPDRKKRIELLRMYLARTDTPPYPRLIAGIALFKALREVRDLEEAEKLATELLPEIKRWSGIPGEVDILESLLEVESDRGDFGSFYRTFEQYQSVAGQWRGKDWPALLGRDLAGIFYRLQEYHMAEEVLQRYIQQRHFKWLRESMIADSWGFENPGSLGKLRVAAEDQLLEARIQLELGQKQEAIPAIQALENGKITSTKGSSGVNDILLQLAEIEDALGRQNEALTVVTDLLKNDLRLTDPDLWAKAMILQGRLRLALGQPLTEIVANLEELVPHLTQFPELNAANAVEMDIFLADYYVAQKSRGEAAARLRRGLKLADSLGGIDQAIILHRKLGELAAQADDLPGAVDQFRQSIDLLGRVSGTIPSDLGKVGYRAERNKAIPLLVVTLFDLYRRSQQPKYLEEMFTVIEEGKSRALAEMLSASNAGSHRSIDLESVRAALPADAALLEYYIPEGADDKVFRLLVDKNTILADVLNLKSDELTARVQALLDEVTTPEQLDETAFKMDSVALGKVLLPPRWSSFEPSPVRRLFIVPTGILYLFPFSLLTDEHGHYLDENEEIDIAYLPSAALLERPVPRFADASRSAGFVNPAREQLHHDELVQTGDLHARLSEAFKKWGGSPIAWEEPMTRREFLQKANSIDNFFIYSHGRFVSDDPMSSYFRVSEENGAGPNVSAADVLANTKTVGGGVWVLAACSTGRGKVRLGDEVLGLPRALLEAGANMVVISLWDVSAHSSLELMTQFYSNLANGLPVARALHRASASLRQAGNSPYDWAPFILIGHHGFQN
jgi:CHAT domain-containing protein